VKFSAVLVTCEHASARVPKRFDRALSSVAQRRKLRTHEGYDIGASGVARRLVSALEGCGVLVAGPLNGDLTRLLVDLNRSTHHPRVFGVLGRELPYAERKALMLRHYLPHHRRVRAELLQLLAAGRPILHLGVHSFTPVLNGQRRNADLGVLYDPTRPGELAFAQAFRSVFGSLSPGLRIRLNYPYRGTADGLTTMLRRELPAKRYAGIELELNQSQLRRPRGELERALSSALTRLLSDAG
jgi:predicted N-formylglutamate amidohydrolase